MPPATAGAALVPSTPDPIDVAVTGSVAAIDVLDGVAYLGGEAAATLRSGPGAEVTGSGGPVDPVTGFARAAAPEVAGGGVLAVVPDGTGGRYLGGTSPRSGV